MTTDDVVQLVKALGWEGRPTTDVFEEARRSIQVGFLVNAEAEVVRRGLRDQYVEALIDLLYPKRGIYLGYDSIDGAPGAEIAFALLTAPLEARVRAMLKALQ